MSDDNFDKFLLLQMLQQQNQNEPPKQDILAVALNIAALVVIGLIAYNILFSGGSLSVPGSLNELGDGIETTVTGGSEVLTDIPAPAEALPDLGGVPGEEDNEVGGGAPSVEPPPVVQPQQVIPQPVYPTAAAPQIYENYSEAQRSEFHAPVATPVPERYDLDTAAANDETMAASSVKCGRRGCPKAPGTGR